MEYAETEVDAKANNYKPRILMQSLNILTLIGPQETAPHLEANHPHGMVYWPVSAFEIIADNLPLVPPEELGETVKSRLHGWGNKTVSRVSARACIIPSCKNRVPFGRLDKLCNEHYAPVSEERIAQWIARYTVRS